MHDIPGIDGDRFMQDAQRAAQEPLGDWVEYAILNPTTGQVTPKCSFVRGIDGGHVLGCGFHAARKAVAA